MSTVATVSLPETLRDGLLRFDEFSQGKTELPESLKVARVDLNGDHVDEFIIQSPQTYSGGPQMYVFEKGPNARFSMIGDAQGTIYFAPRVNGYFEIVSQPPHTCGVASPAKNAIRADRAHDFERHLRGADSYVNPTAFRA